MNQGLAHLNHALYKVLGIRSKCGTPPLCIMYLVSIWMYLRWVEERERSQINLLFAWKLKFEFINWALVHKFCMRSMAKSFQSFLAIDLKHVKSKVGLRKWGANFSAHSLSLSILLSLGTAPTHPLFMCMIQGYGGIKLLLLMYHP